MLLRQWAYKMSFRVLAEVVETEEQLALLRSADYDEAEGFLISKALPAKKIEQSFLAKVIQAVVQRETAVVAEYVDSRDARGSECAGIGVPLLIREKMGLQNTSIGRHGIGAYRCCFSHYKKTGRKLR